MKGIACVSALVFGVTIACGASDGASAPAASAGAKDGGGSTAAEAGADLHAALTHRASDPVVRTGRDLAGLLGAAPGEVVAFARAGGAWTQIPVQVDERFRGDFCQVYAKAKLGDAAPCKTSLVIQTTFYADPATWTGADPDATLDADDEVVFMARHTGDRWSGTGEPAGVKAGSGVEVTVADGDETAYAYLFVRTDPALSAGAGQDLVHYALSFVDEPATFDYKNDYPFSGSGSCGYNPGERPIACDPPILEDSTITTAAYERHFAARWVTDRLRITREGSDGADLLDTAQARFAPNVCGRTVSTFSTAEGAFIANIDGPVRAIRSYLGANSGPITERTHLFYDAMEVTQTMLRVHPIGGIMDLEDYASDAAGMTYFNSENRAGVAIDGRPDVVSAAVPTWELVTGPHGSMMSTLAVNSSHPLRTSAYYLDDANADATSDQCELSNVLHAPDKIAWGQSGVAIADAIPDTDPRNGSVEHVFFERRSYYEPPGFGVADADARVARGILGATTPGTCGDGACDPWENSVSCAADCSTGAPPKTPCGNATCDPGEQALGCATDCWSPAFVPFASCLKTRCGMTDGACGDEQPCVDYVVCVSACVAGGKALDACKTQCDASVATTAEQHDYATALLQCAATQRCTP